MKLIDIRIRSVIALFALIALAMGPLCHAQISTKTEQARATNGVREQLRTIVLSGLAGGVLGLSTLSFYGRPQDNLDNIAGGFCLGIWVGAGYSIYKVSASPRDTFGSRILELQSEDQRSARALAAPKFLAWNLEF